jgi:manganese/iron transport system permease protein/iron/zinc/copper transport system permease protein
VRTGWVDAGFALVLAATIVASMNIVGVTLIAAAIVVPSSTARLVTTSFGKLVALSTALGAATGFTGMFLSFEYDIASGAAIVLLGTAIFSTVYLATAARSWLRRRSGFATHPATETASLGRPQQAPAGLLLRDDHGI